MSADDLMYYACAIISFVVALTGHEVAHGLAAYKLGDPTAKRAGRLSLNPLKHIDPFGTVILPLALMVLHMPIFGYAKPVPYDPRYFKDPRKGDAITGFAGRPTWPWRSSQRSSRTSSSPSMRASSKGRWATSSCSSWLRSRW